MAANINVTYHEMADAAKQLNTGEATIKDDLNRLQSLITHLVSSGFVTDQASKAFDDSYSQFTKGAVQMVEGLNGMASYLNSAAQAMQDTDTQLASAIRGQ
jgi:WXG100 family type VII secretion target